MKLLAVIALAATALPVDSGRLIYQYGEADAPVLMTLQGETGFSQAHAVPCASCHGFDGNGSNEISNLSDISRVAGTAADPAAFRRALIEGVGGDGRKLRIMPRYALGDAQRAALSSYILALATGNAPEPGVSATAVRVEAGTLPDAFVSALNAAAREPANEVYGRHLSFAAEKSDALIRLVLLDDNPALAGGGSRPVTLKLDTTETAAAPATVRALVSIIAKGGRRLTRPGLAELIERTGRGQ